MRGFTLIMAAAVFASTAAAQQSGPPAVKMWQVKSGDLTLDKGWLTAMTDVGKRITAPVSMFIIQHPRGLVLFDTGNNVAVSDGKCDDYWGKGLCGAFTPNQTRNEVIDKQLEKIGFKVDDVKYVIYSHFHLDHVGNIKMFPNATHVTQKEELRAAWWPEKFQRAAFVLKDYDATRNFNFLDLTGDFDLFGDGSIMVLDTKGHTQGHQSLMVRLPKTGVVILTGDAVYGPENEAGTIPGITWNTNLSMQAIDRLKHLRDAQRGQIWFSHDAAQFGKNKRDAYD